MYKIKNSIFLIFLIFLFSCKHKEQFQIKNSVVRKDSLSLIKDTVIFGESAEGTEVKLFKKLYSNDSIIKVETFGEMGNSNYTFIFNKILLSVVHITNHYQKPIYIDSTPKIREKETELLKASNKVKFTDLFYQYKIFFINKKDKKDKKDKKNIVLVNPKWYGKYSFTMNEDSDDWRDMHDISISINKDSITYLAKGFQLYQLYDLSVIEKNDTLKLTFEKDLNGTDSQKLKQNKNFGTITFNKNSYNWKCSYIDINFNNGKSSTYLLKKE